MADEPDNTAATTAPAKERGPRKQATKFGAAAKIAGEHESPEALLKLLRADANERWDLIDWESKDIDYAAEQLKARRAAFRQLEQFVAEIDGLGDVYLGTVKIALEQRVPGSKRKKAAGDAAGE